MRTRELRQKSSEELRSILEEKKIRMDELRFLLRQKKTKNVKELAMARKDIAKILTLFHEKIASNFLEL